MRWSLALFTVAAAGCYARARPALLTQQTLKVLAPIDEHEGVVVTVEPITYVNWWAHPEITARFSWRELDMNAPIPMTSSHDASGKGGMATGAEVQPDEQGHIKVPIVHRFAEMPMVPFPCFKVRVSNQTARPLALDGDVRFEDDAGHRFRPLQGMPEVAARTEALALEQHRELSSELNVGVVEALRFAIARLSLWAPGVVIAPGADWVGFLGFSVDAGDRDEMESFLSPIARMRLVVPLATAPGDAAPPPAPFAFELVRVGRTVRATCPATARTTAWRYCTPDG